VNARAAIDPASTLVPALLLATSFLIGCESPVEIASVDSQGSRVEHANESRTRQLQPGEVIKLFADETFYRDRAEAERRVRGVLSRVAVRTGPNTREHPVRLRTKEGEWGVYSEGLSSRMLDAIMGRPLIITGKWIDQGQEGAPLEVWIGEVAVAGEEGLPQ
jgi:hypothetical protein